MRKKYNTPHRRHVVKTRMTDEEYADFTGRLAAYEISQSEFIRQAIRKATIRPIVTVSPVNDGLLAALSKLTAEYGKIGGNLNQIARSLNEYGSPYRGLEKEVRGAAADLAALKFEVLQKVGEAVGDKTKDVFAAYKASGYNREFYEAHRDALALRSAAKKAFDAYKKENGFDTKLPRIRELNTEYAMLLERKKSSYAEYRKTKSEMQDWLVAQKIVQEILKEDDQKKEQLHEQEVRQEEENRQSSR